jgi:hypothetical protein
MWSRGCGEEMCSRTKELGNVTNYCRVLFYQQHKNLFVVLYLVEHLVIFSPLGSSLSFPIVPISHLVIFSSH